MKKGVWLIEQLNQQRDPESQFRNEYQNVPMDFSERGDGISERPCGCRYITEHGRRREQIYQCRACDERNMRIERHQRNLQRRGQG